MQDIFRARKPMRARRPRQTGQGLGNAIKSLIKKVKDMFRKPTKEEWLAQNHANFSKTLHDRLTRQAEIDRRNQGYTSHTGPAGRRYDPDFVGGKRRRKRVVRRRR